MFCMLCLNETQVGLKVFSDEGNYLQVDKTIRKHFWIVPIEHDEYSNTVCYSCWGLVHSFNDFYKKVEEAHQKHQKTPTKKNVVPIITKIETQTFQHNEQYEDQMEDSNFMEDDFDDPLNPNPSVSVSEEYEPEVIPAKRKRSSTSYKDPDPPFIVNTSSKHVTKDFIPADDRSNSQHSNFQIKSEPDTNPYEHYQSTIPPEKNDCSNDLVGSKLFSDIQQPLDSSGELAQRLDQLSKIVSHLVVNIQDNTAGLKMLTDTLLQPAKITGELIKGHKFPVSNIEEMNALEQKLWEEPKFRSDLIHSLCYKCVDPNNTLNKTIANIMRNLVSDFLLKEFSFKGQSGKPYCFINFQQIHKLFYSVITYAVEKRRLLVQPPETQVDTSVSSNIRHAGERADRDAKRLSKTKTTTDKNVLE